MWRIHPCAASEGFAERMAARCHAAGDGPRERFERKGFAGQEIEKYSAPAVSVESLRRERVWVGAFGRGAELSIDLASSRG